MSKKKTKERQGARARVGTLTKGGHMGRKISKRRAEVLAELLQRQRRKQTGKDKRR